MCLLFHLIKSNIYEKFRLCNEIIEYFPIHQRHLKKKKLSWVEIVIISSNSEEEMTNK